MIQTIFCSILNTIFATTSVLYPGLASGPGQWSVVDIGTCAVKYPSNFYFARERLNSTADLYTGALSLPNGIDDNFSVYYEYRKLDAGPNERVSSASYGEFISQYTLDTNVGQCHDTAVKFPFFFPVPRANYSFGNFIYNYEDYYLPKVAPYGLYEVYGYLVQGREKVGCLVLTTRFQ